MKNSQKETVTLDFFRKAVCLLVRGASLMFKEYDEITERLLWNEWQRWFQRIKSGEEPLTDAQRPLLQKAERTVKRIERKYGRENLRFDVLDTATLAGRVSAISSVFGKEFEEPEEHTKKRIATQRPLRTHEHVPSSAIGFDDAERCG